MKSLPLPLRVAAGLAVTAVERARDLPTRIAGLPVTVASQALQVSMRVQQHVTELAIKGDEALAALRPADESPEWATFDEDSEDTETTAAGYDASRPAFDRVTEDDLADFDEDLEDETDPAGETAVFDDTDDADDTDEIARLSEPVTEGGVTEVVVDVADPWEQEGEASTAPDSVPNYDELSLAQLRARLRSFSADTLEDLLAYERAGANRPSFVGMLTRRIATVRDQT
ncbi:lipid droplet-associated protein [Actinokineospora sp. NBRC 105648]|uniref:lipid droplet-associated protein n=1 Tax=Actinokineospora sp. NBRC 105648 TaxID=3032206 RepID=UPI0024A3A480|nr:lipid droplet-associated protein [Actinokineospora sp. NBRC 105648]GLZ41213.1 hypothetical protein Acsp05_48370 [Actinokineospora sp. NBRC 105648]